MQLEGRNTVLEALKSDTIILKLMVQSNIQEDEKISEILSLSSQKHVTVRMLDKKKLDRLSKTKVHQGVIAFAKESQKLSTKNLIDSLPSGTIPFFVIIREALYEHNTGAIIRTAVCAGANGIILTSETKLSESVIRASMGATNYVKIAKDNLFNSIKILREHGIRVGGIETSAKSYHYDTDLKGPIALIIGGEDHGLSAEVLEKCDFSVRIPMFSKINSLNMSVAAAIVIYEKVRQEQQ